MQCSKYRGAEADEEVNPQILDAQEEHHGPSHDARHAAVAVERRSGRVKKDAPAQTVEVAEVYSMDGKDTPDKRSITVLLKAKMRLHRRKLNGAGATLEAEDLAGLALGSGIGFLARLGLPSG